MKKCAIFIFILCVLGSLNITLDSGAGAANHFKAGNTGNFRAGAAFRIITPDPLLPVSGGVGIPNPATMKKGELSTRALVFEKGDIRVAIVSIDNLGWPSPLCDRVRRLVRSIPPENILIGATHTHSAPDAYGFPDENGKSIADLNYLDNCTGKIAEAINEAVDRLEPAFLRIAVGDAKGRIAYNAYAERLYDPRCGVIQAVAAGGKDKGKSIATLVNYAVHPDNWTLEQRWLAV